MWVFFKLRKKKRNSTIILKVNIYKRNTFILLIYKWKFCYNNLTVSLKKSKKKRIYSFIDYKIIEDII